MDFDLDWQSTEERSRTTMRHKISFTHHFCQSALQCDGIDVENDTVVHECMPEMIWQGRLLTFSGS